MGGILARCSESMAWEARLATKEENKNKAASSIEPREWSQLPAAARAALLGAARWRAAEARRAAAEPCRPEWAAQAGGPPA